MSWTLNGVAFGELGVTDPVMTYRNRAPDTLEFSLPGGVDDPVAYAAYSTIELAYDGVVRFRGPVTATERGETHQGGMHRYTVSSPLYWLDHIVYEQNWNIADDPDLADPTLTPTPTSQVILNQNVDGGSLTAGEQLTHILSFAGSAGAGLSAGSIDIPLVVPWEEMRDRTCAEALDAILRWIPDAVVYCAYDPIFTVVHIRRRSELPWIDLQPTDPALARLTTRPRTDLARPAVVVRYHRTHRLNSYAWEEIETDAYPDPLPADWRLRGLVTSVELAGSVIQAQWLEQPVEVRALPPGLVFGDEPADYVTSGPAFNFWLRHIPALAAPNVSEVTLRNGTHTFTESLPNELVEGAVTDWMLERGIKVEKQTLTVEAAYKIDGEPVFDPAADEVPSFTIEILATNAQTRVYSSLEDTDHTPPEPTPTGLAQSLYETLKGPWTEVSFELVETECSGTWRPGKKTFIWDAPVQEVVENLAEGRTIVTAGPPEHLMANDLVELLRARRDRRLTDAWRRRKTGRST